MATVEFINKRIEGKEKELILFSEALHEKKIARLSDDITEKYKQGGARIVLIAGPSSSGKTTFTKRLAIQLMTNLLLLYSIHQLHFLLYVHLNLMLLLC